MSLQKHSRLHDEDIRYLEAIKKINPTFRLSESMTKKLAKAYNELQQQDQIRLRPVNMPETTQMEASSLTSQKETPDNYANNVTGMNIEEIIEKRISMEIEKVRSQQFNTQGIVQASLLWNIKFSYSKC